jgi:hypothetical protein
MWNRTEQGAELPRVLVNSLPKSGTHLLGSILTVMGLTYQKPVLARNMSYHPISWAWFWDRRSCKLGIGQPHSVPLGAIRFLLGRLRKGCYVLGHIPYQECVDRLLQELDIPSFFVIRDPRDVVVSQVHYYLDTRSHYLHPVYRDLHTDSERFIAAIRGIQEANLEVYGIGRKLEISVGWLESGHVAVLRFEDLIGEAGGGTQDAQVTSICKIGEHLGLSLDPEQAAQIGRQAFGHGRTFRKGQVAAWRDVFDQYIREVFRQEAGEYLIKLGYESGSEW